MDLLRQKLQKYHDLYVRHSHDIDSLRDQLTQDLPNLVSEFIIDDEAQQSLQDYINDRVTLFRFLKKSNFSLASAHLSVLSNLRWRIENSVHTITVDTLHPRFAKSALVTFEGEDRLGRPLLVLRLREWPASLDELLDCDDSDDSEYEDEDEEDDNEEDPAIYIQRLSIFVLEVIRRRTWNLASSRSRENTSSLTLHCSVVLDLRGARLASFDTTTLSFLLSLFKTRYPSCVSQCFVLNYGWAYAGLWQMVRMLLTEEARSRIVFPKTTAEMAQFLPDEIIATAPWDHTDRTMDRDPICIHRGQLLLRNVPSLASLLSFQATPSKSLSSASLDVFFDAIEYSPTHTPFYTPLPSPRLIPSDPFNLTPLTPITPVAPKQPTYITKKPILPYTSPDIHRTLIRRLPSFFRRLPSTKVSEKVTKLGTLVYWILAFVLIRGGSPNGAGESLLAKVLGGWVGKIIEIVLRAGLGGAGLGALGIGNGGGVLVAGV